jgi:hypothetical protein
MASDGNTPEAETVFHLFLRLQDESGNAQITVTVDHNVRLLCQSIDVNFAHAPVQNRVIYWTVSRLTT